jgi:minor histocompatibility antigen H13
VLPDVLNEVKGEFSLLGLGDIVIPGLFVALLLRYDASAAQVDPRGCVSRAFPRPHFSAQVLAYAAGLCVTVGVMYFFDHGQPALLYLVPACLGTSLVMALAKGDAAALFAYDEETAHAALKAAAALEKEESEKKKSE